MIKYVPVLGGHSVQYSYPEDIKKELNGIIKEINNLKVNSSNKRETVFNLTRIIIAIWKIHPFERETLEQLCRFLSF